MTTAKKAAEKVREKEKLNDVKRIEGEWRGINDLIEKAVKGNKWYIEVHFTIHEQNKKTLVDLGYSVVVSKSFTNSSTKISWGSQ